MALTVKLPSLAGSMAGKHIRYVPGVENAIKTLMTAAKRGNYYPMLAVKQLCALTQGAIGKSYVFIPGGNDSANHTMQNLDVYVPGIKARVERRSNDEYIVTYLEISGGWDQLHSSDEKPGVYEVENRNGAVILERRSRGTISREDGRIVAVCDGQYSEVKRAVDAASRALKKSPWGGTVQSDGKFDLIYSPTGCKLDGGRRYDPNSITEAHASASIVAEAMASAVKLENIKWVSEYGGSAVLSQAMGILAQKNVTLSQKGHSIYMYKPKTSRDKAVALAQQLGIGMEAGFASTAYTPRSIISDFAAKRRRVKNNNDSYSNKDYGKDLATYSLAATGLAGCGLYFGGLAATAGLLSAGIASTINTAGLIASGIGTAATIGGVGTSLLEDARR